MVSVLSMVGGEWFSHVHRISGVEVKVAGEETNGEIGGDEGEEEVGTYGAEGEVCSI